MIFRDLRFAIRTLSKRPGFSLIAVVTLALGIGANTAIFSLVNTVLFRPFPIAEPDRLISINNLQEGRLFPTFSYPDYRDFRDRGKYVAELLGYRFAPLSISHDGINERLWGYLVTGNYFDMLGIKAAYGRLISPSDDVSKGGHPVVVIGYSCWQARFGSSPDIIGRNINVNGRRYTVIGVAPQGFNGTETVANPEMWFPMAMQAQIEVGNDWLEDRNVANVFIQSRLKNDVTQAQAEATFTSIAVQLGNEFPESHEGRSVSISKPGFMGGTMRGSVIGFAGVLMVVVGLVLLLACVNLANLLLARAAEQRREIAIRLAIGAGRWQIVRQLLTESLLLSVIGGALGFLVAFWLVDLTKNVKLPIDVPVSIEIFIDYRVLIFTCLISILTGLLFGLLPALQATKTDLLAALKDEMPIAGLKRSRLKNGLIVFQVALSFLLLICGGLVLRSLLQAETVRLGFDPRNAIEATFDLRLQGYDEGAGLQFQKTLLDRLRANPEVRAAGIADLVPVDLHFGRTPVYIEGRPVETRSNVPRVMSNRVSTGYFEAMSTGIVQGRVFNEHDNQDSQPVAIVNRTFAGLFWPGEDPIGKRFSLGSPEAPRMTVVGIAEDGKYANLGESPSPFVYRPLWQQYTGTSALIVRGAGDTRRLMAIVTGELRQLDPNLPVSNARTMSEHMSLPLLPARIAAVLLGSFGLLALALAAIGLYGVMSFTVSKRTREIGIRIALGAGKRDILMLITSQGMILTLAGVAVGMLMALGLTQLLRRLLFGITPTDPATFILISVILTIVAFLACLVPALRAAKTDPMITLRCE